MLRDILFCAKLPDPPTPHLLCSNIPPSESEATLIYAVIAEAKAEEQRLSKLLLDRPGSRSASWKMVTRYKIGQAAKFIHAHEAIISPIRRITPEILQEIFSFILEHPIRVPYRRVTRDLPWTPSQVCQSWRATALSLPSLWNHLPTVDATRLTKTKTKLQLEVLNELLRRSANTLLSVHIFAPGVDLRSPHPAVGLLVQHSERWGTFIIHSTPSTIADIQGIRGRLPSLRALELTISRSQNDYSHTRLDIFEVAPQLRLAHVNGRYFGDVVLPLQRLVHYKGEMGPMFRITQLCDSRVLKILTLSESIDSNFDSGKMITLPHLVRLTFTTYRSAETSFLRCVSFPAIEDLHIISRQEILYQLLHQQFCALGFLVD
ncbi:hypothetical protein BDZ97DRAFT_2074595 [Flammula alnicola]|nr:hypothetical protein BDZ97DRAFT_2074595 [Flammula alnicola]